MKWKDNIRYPKKDKKDILKSSELITKSMRITIYRHIDYEPDQWLFSCHNIDLFQVELRSKNIDCAKKETVEIVKHVLTSMLKELEEITD